MSAQMIKHVSGPAILALLILASIPVSAQTDKLHVLHSRSCRMENGMSCGRSGSKIAR